MLPRIIGQGRASELLFLGRTMTAEEGERWGFYNHIYAQEDLMNEAQLLASRLAKGPTFANGITKQQLYLEWDMNLFDAIDSEARAQALCMQKKDFKRAYDAFVAKKKPDFKGD